MVVTYTQLWFFISFWKTEIKRLVKIHYAKLEAVGQVFWDWDFKTKKKKKESK